MIPSVTHNPSLVDVASLLDTKVAQISAALNGRFSCRAFLAQFGLRLEVNRQSSFTRQLWKLMY
jgi:hypothetical protein